VKTAEAENRVKIWVYTSTRSGMVVEIEKWYE
jgi:hypothetical protein